MVDINDEVDEDGDDDEDDDDDDEEAGVQTESREKREMWGY